MIPFKFGHLCDIHLGNYPGKIEKGGLNARFLDFVKTFNQSIDTMIADKVDFCLIPGDIFKTKKPSPDELDAFVSGIIKLQKSKIPTIVTLGNHDLFLMDGGIHSISSINRMFDYIKSENGIDQNGFILSSKPEIITITVRGQKIQIQTMPYPIRSALKLETKEDVELYMIKTINDIYDSRDKSIPIIFAGHFSIKGSEEGGEQVNFDKFSEPVISSDIFKGKDYLYVAMGHLHKYQVMMKKPLLVYCGSNNRVDFNEAKEDKGFVEVFVDNGVSHKFVKVDARKYIDIKYDISEEKDPTEKMMMLLTERIDEIKDSVVRLTISVSSKNAKKYDDEEVARFLNKHCYHIHGTTTPIIKHDVDIRNVSGFVESMDVFAALKHYANVKNIKDKDAFVKLGNDVVRKTRGGNTNVLSQL